MAIDSMTRATQKVCRTTHGDITSDVASPTMLPALKFSSDPGCTYAFAKCSWLGPKNGSAMNCWNFEGHQAAGFDRISETWGFDGLSMAFDCL